MYKTILTLTLLALCANVLAAEDFNCLEFANDKAQASFEATGIVPAGTKARQMRGNDCHGYELVKRHKAAQPSAFEAGLKEHSGKYYKAKSMDDVTGGSFMGGGK